MQEMGYLESSRAHADFPHFEVLKRSQIREKYAQNNEAMPDLVTMTAGIVLARVAPFGTLVHIHVEAEEVGGAEKQVIRSGGGELKGVPVVIIEELIDEQMAQRDGQRKAEGRIEHSLILLIFGAVDPLEETDDEAGGSKADDAGEVDDGDLELAVHAVVQGGEGAAGNQHVDPCVVEPVGDCVDFCIGARVLLDIGQKRWNTVLQSRQNSAVDRNSTTGHREISCGFGSCYCSSITWKSQESISRFSYAAFSLSTCSHVESSCWLTSSISNGASFSSNSRLALWKFARLRLRVAFTPVSSKSMLSWSWCELCWSAWTKFQQLAMTACLSSLIQRQVLWVSSPQSAMSDKL